MLFRVPSSSSLLPPCCPYVPMGILPDTVEGREREGAKAVSVKIEEGQKGTSPPPPQFTSCLPACLQSHPIPIKQKQRRRRPSRVLIKERRGSIDGHH